MNRPSYLDLIGIGLESYERIIKYDSFTDVMERKERAEVNSSGDIVKKCINGDYSPQIKRWNIRRSLEVKE